MQSMSEGERGQNSFDAYIFNMKETYSETPKTKFLESGKVFARKKKNKESLMSNIIISILIDSLKIYFFDSPI